MSRKIGLLVMGFLLYATNVWAGITYGKTVVVTNDTPIDSYENITYVSISDVVPLTTLITSYTVTPTRHSDYNAWVALYDAANAGDLAEANLLGESEAVNKASVDKIFPYPKRVLKQLAVWLGPYSEVTIDIVK